MISVSTVRVAAAAVVVRGVLILAAGAAATSGHRWSRAGRLRRGREVLQVVVMAA